MAATRLEAAGSLADDLLEDIELGRLNGTAIARKASRLARLLDDADAVNWLRYEVTGYSTVALSSAESAAAERSGRGNGPLGDQRKYWSSSLAHMAAVAEAGRLAIQSMSDTTGGIHAINARAQQVKVVAESENISARVVGAIYAYVSRKQIQLRFGSSAETAFESVRHAVDAKVASLVPEASNKIATAFEGVSSDNPERWANAAMECRRLIKAVADALRPAGPPVGSREMTDDKYINRLIDWIEEHVGDGQTYRDVVVSDLEDFGKRIDALDDAGHKGAHAEVTQLEAARFVTGAYLLVGDILNLNPEALPGASA